MTWYAKVVQDDDDSAVLQACAYFDDEFSAAIEEVEVNRLRGSRLDDLAKRLPGIVGFRYCQLQELEAILGFLDIRETAIKGRQRRHYLEHYNRVLTPTTLEKYVESDDAVIAAATLRNQVALVRNKYLGLCKQHEYLHYQLGNIIKLLVAGVDDALL